MARETKGNGQEDTGPHSIVDSIKALCAFNARADLDTEKRLLLFLQSWWSRTYNRPLKDPLLKTYTVEELLYEFYDRIERKKAEEEQEEASEFKKEDDKDKAAQDWAEQEEQRELNAMKSEATAELVDPTKDPQNVAWMEEQIKKAKEIHGDSFGEDIEETFDT